MTKPSLVLVPGWGAGPRSMEPLRNACAGWDVHCVSWFDLLREGEPLLRRSAENLACPRYLAGWSLGAVLALKSATRTPALWQGLVLCSGTAHFCDGDGYPGTPLPMLRAMRAKLQRTPERVLIDFAANCAAPGNDLDVMKDFLEEANHFTPEALDLGLDALATLDLRGELANVTLPVLAVHGKKDRIVPVEQGRFVMKHVPQGHFCAHPKAGHCLPLSAPDFIANALNDWTATHG